MKRTIKYKKLRKNVPDLKRKYTQDVGFDLYWYPPPGSYDLDKTHKEWYNLDLSARHLFSTGILIDLPLNVMGLILDKSGIAVRNGLHVMGGVIDPGYKGEIKVLLINNSDTKILFKKGSPLAQIIFIPVAKNSVLKVSELFNNSERGDSGFNSQV